MKAAGSQGRTETTPAGRNAPCPCGSGRKFKQCCMVADAGAERDAVVPLPSAGGDAGSAAAEETAPLARARANAGVSSGLMHSMVLPLTLVLAFCSILYELLLGQTLAAFLGNTVLRYSVTVGLYMLSMGIGAMLAQSRILRRAVLSLQLVEIALTVLGGSAVILLFAIDALRLPTIVLSVFAHAMIVLIGVLSGLEIPLLIELRAQRDSNAASGVLGVDYLGAFLGTVAFALYFYPRAGLVPTAFLVASLNAAVGTLLFVFRSSVADGRRGLHRLLVAGQGALLVVLLICLTFSSEISEYCLGHYLDH